MAKPDFSNFTPVDQKRLWADFMAIERVFKAHKRRILRDGADGPMDFAGAEAALAVREHHAPPWPIDPVLLGIREVLHFAAVATGTLKDPNAYMAAWRFPCNAASDLGVLAIYTEIPKPRLVCFYRGLWDEALLKLQNCAINEADFGMLVTHAQAMLSHDES